MIYVFHKGIIVKGNVNNLVQDLNLIIPFHFQQR